MNRSACLAMVASMLILVGCGLRASADPSTVIDPSPPAGLRYVALGESYMIGTSVGMAGRFPDQLVEALGAAPPGLDLVANLGVNG